MHASDISAEFSTEYLDGMTVSYLRDVGIHKVLDALRTPGETLKISKKSETRRVGEWVVKASRRDMILGPIKHTVLRSRYRRGWWAIRYLARHGIGAPRPIAFIESGRFGIVTGNAMISEFLGGCCDVEAFADAMIARNAGTEEIHTYLSRLAGAVNALCACGAYHTDLAGKNILTRDGTAFYFIDPDGIVLGRPYTNRERLENHVQLYDSFCDRWDDSILEAFMAHMMSGDANLPAWMEAVRRRQAVRRARTEAIWRKQGRI